MTEIIFPDAVYFDTNALRAVRYEFVSSELAELQDLAKRFYLKLCVPDVVFDELLKVRYEQTASKIQSFNGYADDLRNVLGLDVQKVPISNSDARTRVESYYRRRFEDLGIEIIEIPTLSLRQVYGERFGQRTNLKDDDAAGFKDMAILETILQHSAEKSRSRQIILASSDKFFQQDAIGQIFKAEGVDLILVSGSPSEVIVKTSKEIEALVSKAGMKMFSIEQEKALNYL